MGPINKRRRSDTVLKITASCRVVSRADVGYPYNKLQARTLYLQVMDYDRFCRDDPIGELCVPLSDVDLLRGETLFKTLQPCKGHTVSIRRRRRRRRPRRRLLNYRLYEKTREPSTG